MRKIISIFLFLFPLVLTQVSINECFAKSTSTHQLNQKKNTSAKTKKNVSKHYVIVYKDERGNQKIYNTYAKSKDEAKHNLLQSRKVSKIINTNEK